MRGEDGLWSDRLPGPELAAALAEVDLAGVDDGELVDVLAAWRRQASWAQAGELAAVAELGRRRRAGSSCTAEFASAEVGLALAISSRSADAHLDLADTLAGRLPLTRSALVEGRIDLVKARIIAQGTRAVEEAIARAVEERVLPGVEHVTPGRLRARVERVVITVDPAGAERRRKACEADRRIACYDTGNGTAVLGGMHLPAGPAIAADNRVHAIAKALKTNGDTRTVQQLSADVFLSLLLGTHPGSGLPTTELTTALTRAALNATTRHTGLPRAAPDAGPQDNGLPHTTPDATTQRTRVAETARDVAADGHLGRRRGPARGCDAPLATGDNVGERAGHPTGGPVLLDHPDARADRATARVDSRSTGDAAPQAAAPQGDTPQGDARQGDARQGDARQGDGRRGGLGAGLRVDPAAIARGVGERIGTVHLTVPLATLLGLSSEPGEAAGYGPLTAEAARQMAATASNPATRWCLTVTTTDGMPLHHGHLAYRPPAAMAHTVRALQPTCRFPGCTRPSKDCDLDHRTPYHQEGPTCPCNLQPLCRRHHRTKGAQGWNVAQQTDGLSWTTPAGKTYLTRPEPPPPQAVRPLSRRSPLEARLRRCLRDNAADDPSHRLLSTLLSTQLSLSHRAFPANHPPSETAAHSS